MAYKTKRKFIKPLSYEKKYEVYSKYGQKFEGSFKNLKDAKKGAKLWAEIHNQSAEVKELKGTYLK